MEMQTVTSSTIVAIGFDEKESKMAIRFKHGGVYHFSGVSEDAYKAFKEAESVGKHFHSHIRPKYTGVRQGEAVPDATGL